MVLLVLIGLLVLVVFGCVCVFWAARGGPRWTRVVSVITLGAGEVARKADVRSNRTGKTDLGD